ncbi:hypothetical protein R1flu_021558 [Riccia fluitans]|uniref:Uncharacterized protein n=1 Tax=Riccia fluitans TaxID=41844 RepID=A0ABD1ZPQ1_9MARC
MCLRDERGMTMSHNIHLYHLRGNKQSMISMGLIGFKEGDTLLSLRQKLEEDLEGKVVLFKTKDSEESNLALVGPRVETEPPVMGTQPVETNVIYKELNKEIVDVSIGSSEPSIIGNDRLEGKALFLSKRMSHAVETAWREQVERLIIWQQKENKVDHECRVNHCAEIDAACAIVEKVNGEELSQKKPFVVEGDVKREPCYSWIFKIRCVYYGSKFELVPSKRNLEHNLREHLSSEKHRENVEFQLCSTSHGPVHSGAKGRLKKFDPRDLKRQRRIDQRGLLWRNPSTSRLMIKKMPSEKNKKEEREPRKTLLEVLLEHFISYCQHAKKYRQRLEEGIENPLGDKDTHLRMFISDQYPDSLQWVCFKDDVQYLDLTTFLRQAYTLAVADVP